jgi:hypothetical protein
MYGGGRQLFVITCDEEFYCSDFSARTGAALWALFRLISPLQEEQTECNADIFQHAFLQCEQFLRIRRVCDEHKNPELS